MLTKGTKFLLRSDNVRMKLRYLRFLLFDSLPPTFYAKTHRMRA
jgi:hypothetical protein